MESNADQLIELFHEAKARPSGAERDRFLRDACQGQPEMEQQVITLLEADKQAGDFLSSGLANLPGPLPVEKPGDRLGHYKLLERIGEGGCGVVYLAEQEEPVRRRVALKIIKLGMDTRAVVARFGAERQALSLMDHPNIARVLDAGATETGRPYFVMELVRGTRITDFCDQNNFSTNRRLELLVQVCHAVQHAHQKGIIHRDLKPSNILVTTNDGVPVPKVIDFGIAKATQGRLTDETLFTAFEQFIGTPAYMSPEQAELAMQDVDTRTDIYSLGVLLYELLTGRTPFDTKDLLDCGLDAMRRSIREQEPARPSNRLSRMLEDELTKTASHRNVGGPKLIHLLRGDLDWIVMKCLEKDPVRRYETASALADDVRHYLSNQPVLARPPTKLYRFQKLAGRNKTAFGAAAAVFAALVLGVCVACWGLVRERAARQQAESARMVASAESERNAQVARFFANAGIPSMYQGNDTKLVHSILDRLSHSAGNELANQPAAQGDIINFLANNYAAIGDLPAAVTNLELAVRSYRRAFASHHVSLALALAKLGAFQSLNGQIAEGKKSCSLGVEMARRCGDPETLATCLLETAQPLSRLHQSASQTIPLLRETLRLRKEVVPNFLAQIEATRLLAKALASEGGYEEAKALTAEALRMTPTDTDLLELLDLLSTNSSNVSN